MPSYLTKSDFKVARTCPTKLFYRKNRLPTTTDDDAYLRLLARGGFMIEEIARAQYPEGIAVSYDGGSERSIAETQRWIDQPGDLTLFEPTFVHDGRLVRVDIFRRLGTTIELIEVKAKSWRSDAPDEEDGSFVTKKGVVRSKWRKYIEDVAYQALVLEALFPGHTVIPYLFMPDKAKTASRGIVHERFRIEERVDERGRTFYDIGYEGDPADLRGDHFLTRVNVSEPVELVRGDVEAAIPELTASLDPLVRIEPVLGQACFGCEYRTGGDDGFSQCWGAGAHDEPHLVDLYYGGRYADECIAHGMRRIRDIDTSLLTRKDGSTGSRNERQHIQVSCTRSGEEWVGDGLRNAIAGHAYPHHFIDFETCTMAVPFHEGMRPYEDVAFQWSCHTVSGPGAEPTYAEWINTDQVFPNFAFAESLREQVGDEGTVFMWSHHENSILKHIHRQMVEQGYDGPAKAWIERVAALEKGDQSALVDMWPICLKHYCHPRMGKRTSIKNVLDAVWQEAPWLRERFPEYGAGQSPYKGLPVVTVGETVVDVAEGTGAIRAYEAMMYGRERDDPAVRDAWRDALLR